MAYGLANGLELSTMLDVLNGSSGHNTATSDKFPNHVLTGTYASGFSNSLMAKDVGLYMSGVGESGSPQRVGSVVTSIWAEFAAAEPDVDFTRIFPFMSESRR